MSKYIVEFIGTFFLVLIIGLTAGTPGAAALAPIAIGFGLTVLVYMGGHISGAHYNPAVTLAIFIRGKINAADAGAYVVAQIAAGIVAGLSSLFLIGDQFGAPALNSDYSIAQGMLVEILLTFLLVFVILNVATHSKTAGNDYYGLAIGATVLAAAYAGGGISGGAFNPAVGIGPNIVKGAFGDLALYTIGPVVGAVLAAILFKIVNPKEA